MARVTFFARRQDVQTRAVRAVPRSLIFTDCRLGSQRRLVLFIAWLTLLPAIGPLLQTSQRFAILLYNPLRYGNPRRRSGTLRYLRVTRVGSGTTFVDYHGRGQLTTLRVDAKDIHVLTRH